MAFELHPFMLLFVAIGAYAVYVLLNQQKFIDRYRRQQERSRLPKFFLSSHRHPTPQLLRVGAIGMLVISAFNIIGIGIGLIEV